MGAALAVFILVLLIGALPWTLLLAGARVREKLRAARGVYPSAEVHARKSAGTSSAATPFAQYNNP